MIVSAASLHGRPPPVAEFIDAVAEMTISSRVRIDGSEGRSDCFGVMDLVARKGSFKARKRVFLMAQVRRVSPSHRRIRGAEIKMPSSRPSEQWRRLALPSGAQSRDDDRERAMFSPSCRHPLWAMPAATWPRSRSSESSVLAQASATSMPLVAKCFLKNSKCAWLNTLLSLERLRGQVAAGIAQ